MSEKIIATVVDRAQAAIDPAEGIAAVSDPGFGGIDLGERRLSDARPLTRPPHRLFLTRRDCLGDARLLPGLDRQEVEAGRLTCQRDPRSRHLGDRRLHHGVRGPRPRCRRAPEVRFPGQVQ